MYKLFQRLLAGIAVLVLSPIFLVIALAIKLESKGPVLFKQERIGKDNHHFQIYKFRSMYTETPNVPTHLLADPSVYITKVGGFLRKTSLDELPQLWNIVMGDMMFVGPRPALYNQDDLKQLRTECNVHQLVPGVTGWAQINGRDELEIPEKVKFDAEYLHKWSPWFDLKIMILTVVKVFKTDGIVEGKWE
ncbi:MAG: sugar transferase [Culicoidibacterales bacterium]